jgi:hypothetical protein
MVEGQWENGRELANPKEEALLVSYETVRQESKAARA